MKYQHGYLLCRELCALFSLDGAIELREAVSEAFPELRLVDCQTHQTFGVEKPRLRRHDRRVILQCPVHALQPLRVPEIKTTVNITASSTG